MRLICHGARQSYFSSNHAMRSWLFGVLLSESAERAPDAELLAVATILHDLGLTDRYTAEKPFRGGWRQCGALVSEGARHLDAADASCLGCHRASYHTIYRSSQRARSGYEPIRE